LTLHLVRAGLALVVLAATAVAARAEDPVTIGAIYALTGAAASGGQQAKAALETAADIVNTPHKGLQGLPLGAGVGLPGLGGAKIALGLADDLGNPSVAQSQVLRLAGQERVTALIGTGQAATTLAATAAAERRGMPFLVPDGAAPGITSRGFGWVFRTAPREGDEVRAYTRFLTAAKQGGTTLDAVAFLSEDTEPAGAAQAVLSAALKAAGFMVAPPITYKPNATDLSPQATQLRDAHPDAVIVVGHAADAIVLAKTMRTLDYKPPLLLGDDCGFIDPEFVAAVGNLAQGAIDRSAWVMGNADSPTALVNALYKTRSGRDLDDASARIMQGFFVLADAINRAGATDPAAIQKALRETDFKPGQLIVGYDGVKFDESGQNALAATYLVQLQGKEFVAVWPDERATGKPVLPFKGWE
jgi:branched-chain amino acid transport system substrate-binding protein